MWPGHRSAGVCECVCVFQPVLSEGNANHGGRMALFAYSKGESAINSFCQGGRTFPTGSAEFHAGCGVGTGARWPPGGSQVPEDSLSVLSQNQVDTATGRCVGQVSRGRNFGGDFSPSVQDLVSGLALGVLRRVTIRPLGLPIQGFLVE